MDNLKSIVAKNITQLRIAKGMTQLELAEKLNYSDKAVSKWERGDSLPDITVLAQISEMFGVTLDYLIHTHKEADDSGMKLSAATKKKNHVFITGMSILLVWLVSTLGFVILSLVPIDDRISWLSFLYAVPVTMIVWLVFNSVWFNRHRNFLIISLLVWSTLAAIQLSFLLFGVHIWLIYLLGIPGQIIIFMWSRLRFKNTSARRGFFDKPDNKDKELY